MTDGVAVRLEPSLASCRGCAHTGGTGEVYDIETAAGPFGLLAIARFVSHRCSMVRG